MTRPAVLLLAALLAAPALGAQGYVPRDERGDLFARAQTTLDGNRVRSGVYNFGVAGRLSGGPDEVPFEWPAFSRQYYLALTGLFVGAQVESATGETTAIVDLPVFRQNAADPSAAWTWAPVPEYAADGEIARSDRPETWPSVWPDKLGDASDPGWPGAWNGILGKDAFVDGVETYTHYTDDQYDRNRRDPATTYIPDPADPDRAGLGIVVSERRLAIRSAEVQDALFSIRDLYNVGTQDLDRVGATVWVADLVGGDPDASDDQPVVFEDQNVIVFSDADGQSSDQAFAGDQPVGAAALVLLAAPDGLGFTTIRYRDAGGVNVQSISDEDLFQQFMAPADDDAFDVTARDQDTFASVGLFGIDAGTSVRIATALVFGEVDYSTEDPEVRFAEVLAKAEAARAFYAEMFATSGQTEVWAQEATLRAPAPNPFATQTRLSFSLAESQGARVEVFDRLGRRVAVLADRPYVAGSHTVIWDTRSAAVASGVYLVRLTTRDAVVAQTVTVAR